MGIYETPYEDFGRLSYEMWRATRLVIDTGIHAFGWSREQAIAYLRDNTALRELEVVNEIDRYISWPGQAPAYKLGELQIRRLRAEAESRPRQPLRPAPFPRRDPGAGSVPFPMLEERIRAFIAESADSSGRLIEDDRHGLDLDSHYEQLVVRTLSCSIVCEDDR